MTPAARVQTAIELLDRILDGAPAERTLTQWARNARFAGSKDRAAVRDHVYDVLRQKMSCAAHGGGGDGRALMLGLLRLQGIAPEDIFTGTTYAPAALTDAERKAPVADDVLNLPDWIVPHFQSALGDDFPKIEQLLRNRAPVVLRVNLQKITPANAITKLADEGITAKPHGLSDTALEVNEGQRRIKGSAAYANGLIELQDSGSQAAIDMLPLQDGMKILDYCAGGGGKLLAMAGKCKGRFFAHDAFPQRLKDLPQRAKRAGVKATELATDKVAAQGPYDLIFCDVPCSGSGTWRRDPDSKWRITPEGLQDLLTLQAEIMDIAAPMLRPGGMLAYATCSLLRQENHDQVSAFLNRHQGWTLEAQRQWTPLENSDGFFLSILKAS